MPQPPKIPEGSPNLVHGRIDPATAPKSASPVTSNGRFRGRGGTGVGAVAPSGPRTSARHSGPITRPRTGTAHRRQSGRPQESHRATDGLEGWDAQRAALRVN